MHDGVLISVGLDAGSLINVFPLLSLGKMA